MRLRVLVVSDVRVVQEGVSSVLASRCEVDVVGTADVPHARDQTERLHPDAVLLDAARAESIDCVPALVASSPHSRVIAFGVKETDELILALAAAGTACYVRDSAGGGDVVRVLKRVMRDELPCSPRAAASLFRQVALLAHGVNDPAGHDAAGTEHLLPAPTVPLSRRELQVARLIDCGLTNKEIGRRLGIETATVKNHVHNMCEKLQVHRRAAATARLRGLRALSSSAPAPKASPALEASWRAGPRPDQ
jgi:DNA-binding NarL/FixJ family response regulator